MTTSTQQVVVLLNSIETGEAGPVSVTGPPHNTRHQLSAQTGREGLADCCPLTRRVRNA